VGAVLDLARDQWRAPEQAHEQRQEPQQDADRAQAPEAAGELGGQVLAGADRVGGPVGTVDDMDVLDAGGRPQAAGQAGPLERVVHLDAGRHQEGRQCGQPEQGEQRLLAVLAPDQPDHACTSRLSSWAGPGRVPAAGSAR
jgi:hypothetical protein